MLLNLGNHNGVAIGHWPSKRARWQMYNCNNVTNVQMRSPPEEPHLAVRLVFFLGDFYCLS